MSQDKITAELEKREIVRKGLNRLRAQDKVPGVIHDHGKPSINVAVDYNTLDKLIIKAGKHSPISTSIDDKKLMVMIKKFDYEPKKHRLSHVVFNAISAREKVEAEVPVKAIYDGDNESSPAERAGLVVLNNLDVVTIEALPADLPPELNFNAESLVEAGDQVTVAELILPSGVTVLTEPEHVLATVFEPSALAAANDSLAGEATDSDEAEVQSEHGDAADDVPGQDAENRPGGKEQKESKDQGRNPEK